jgi:hypothetical protein
MATLKEYNSFLFLLTKNDGLSTVLAENLENSDQDPKAFFKEHKEDYFSNRGISKAGDKEQTLCFLIDILIENEIVYELDWKADVYSINDAIQVLSKGKITIDIISEEEASEAEDMNDLIEMADEKLMNYQLGILQFWLDSDSFPIALVPLAECQILQKMLDDLFQ